MTEVLLVYGSTHGHTARIVGRLAEVLRAQDCQVELHDATQGEEADATDSDLIVVAGSVHKGHHQRELIDWVKAHADELADRPSAFFSVSLTAAEDTDEARGATQHMIDVFVEETGWRPGRSFAIAGALQYREYDFFTRTLMRLLMRRGGHPTDASRDYDYTDWDAVERYGRELAAMVAPHSSPSVR